MSLTQKFGKTRLLWPWGMLLLSQLFRNVSLKKEKNYPLYVHRNILYINDKKLQRYELQNTDTYSCISVPLFILKKSQQSQQKSFDEFDNSTTNRCLRSRKSILKKMLILKKCNNSKACSIKNPLFLYNSLFLISLTWSQELANAMAKS